MATPLILPLLLAVITFPPTEVVAPNVIVCRFTVNALKKVESRVANRMSPWNYWPTEHS
jgi:hypothetical protein